MPDAAVHLETRGERIGGLPAAVGIGYEHETAGAPIAVHDPATGRTIGWCVPTASVTPAVAAAQAGFGTWSRLVPAARAAAIREGAVRIAARREEFERLLVAEVGKPRAEAAGDVGGAIGLLHMFADLASNVGDVHDHTGAPGSGAADEVLIHRAPVGPVAVITPWNSPVYLTMNCVAPALAAGCSVVVKPAEAAPLAVTAALEELASALPAGAVVVVQGTGAAVGGALAAAPGIRAVSFVGGVVAGRRVLAAAAETVKKVTLELGGNDPAIVLEDADLGPDTIRELIAGCYALSGQVCFNIKRIYVHRSRYDEFVDAFTAAVDELVVGPGDDPRVHLGPLTTAAGLANARRLIESAREAGAHVYEGGSIADTADPVGFYQRPTVVTGIPADHELVIEEQFAPVIPVLAFDTDDEAVFEANRTEYGLCSSVWTASPRRAREVGLRIEAGNTFVNAHRVGASVPAVPFGGFKQSGLGRNHLWHAIAECTEEHALIRYDDASRRRIPGGDHWPTPAARSAAATDEKERA